MSTTAWSTSLTAGETFRRRVTWKVDGTGVDLTEWTARMQVRDKATNTLVIELSTDNGRLTLDGEGHVDMFIDETDTAELTPGRYVFDVRLTNGTDVRYILNGSSLRVKDAVTE